MILILLVGFALTQLLGLLIHTFNQIKLLQTEEEQEFATRAVTLYRHIALTAPAGRNVLLAKETLPNGETATLSAQPPLAGTLAMPAREAEAIRTAIFSEGIPPLLHPAGLILRVSGFPPRLFISFGLRDFILFRFENAGQPGHDQGTFLAPFDANGWLGPAPSGAAPPGAGGPPFPPFGLPPGIWPGGAVTWLTVSAVLPPPAPWRSPGFATAFIVMTLLGALMIVWAVRTLLRPVQTLAAAAEALGRDVVTAPPLPEQGAAEIVTAAKAFNTMAARIRRFVDDRTFLLTAIGHDLRTPITRLKLRAEFMEDDEQREKMLADLDEMEAMVAATLAFGRDIGSTESPAPVDLASLLRAILDDQADLTPARQEAITYSGPEHLAVRLRPLACKRAFANLIGNAVKYGDAARVTLTAPQKGLVRIDIEDDGPGIPELERERVFEPFRRLETSRNRETGGSGLGLAIARNIIRAHGGDIVMLDAAPGGLRVRVTLPA
ncbi:ATP-binding protein [Acidocella sp.]|uniref:ATP-binding protein n=1 Tax=Acidocella sp. TaxID=50710 RepID=UPI0026077706|nr:ATP-binding protein [Acidocella sp.]